MNHQINCLVAQSGGPTTVINSSLAGVIAAASESPEITTIYGAVNGIQGVMEQKLINLSQIFYGHPEDLERLKLSPSMFLGSCRYKLPDIQEGNSDYFEIFKVLKEYKIHYFFYIGGNDSMDTVDKLSSYAKKINFPVHIIGIPKTIDNDLPCIDHTPGYGSAAKYIASSVLEMAHDTYIYNTPSVLIVEIMGRNAGWLTAASALARNNYNKAPHLIYLPEKSFQDERFLIDVEKLLDSRKHVVIAVSEGIKYEDGSYVSTNQKSKDQFGHAMLSGAGKYLENLVRHSIGCKVRSVEINVLQRCASHLASQTDIEEAFLLGLHGVKLALTGHSGEMVVLLRKSNHPYKISYDSVPISQVANREKTVPLAWIDAAGNNVTEEFMEYARPLIQGEASIKYQNGIPAYLPVEHLYEREY